MTISRDIAASFYKIYYRRFLWHLLRSLASGFATIFIFSLSLSLFPIYTLFDTLFLFLYMSVCLFLCFSLFLFPLFFFGSLSVSPCLSLFLSLSLSSSLYLSLCLSFSLLSKWDILWLSCWSLRGKYSSVPGMEQFSKWNCFTLQENGVLKMFFWELPLSLSLFCFLSFITWNEYLGKVFKYEPFQGSMS